MVPSPVAFCQAGLAAGLLGLLALTPPSHGAILLIDPTGGAHHPVQLALAHGARLLGTGPLPGSVVVVGDRAALAPPAGAAGLLLLAAPSASCGNAPERRA